MLIFIVIFLIIVAGIGGFLGWNYISRLRRDKDIERSLKIVPLLIKLPPASPEESAGRDQRELIDENIVKAEGVFNLLSGIATHSNMLYGRKFISMEIVARGERIYFYLGVPVSLLSAVEKALISGYPNIQIEKVEDYNIFSLEGKIHTVAGGELNLTNESYYPINHYKLTDFDPLSGLITSMSKLKQNEGVSVQILIRPVGSNWYKNAQKKAKDILDPNKKKKSFAPAALSIAKAPFVAPEDQKKGPEENKPADSIDQKTSQLVEEKSSKPAFESLIRLVVSSDNMAQSKIILQDILTGFSQFNLPNSNGFEFKETSKPQKLATDDIFRFFPVTKKKNILNSMELATIFHLPRQESAQLATPVERTAIREVGAPANLSDTGSLLGENLYRGGKKQVFLSDNDRRRHLYIIGQTGTGKSVLLENMAVQDMAAGKGFALIDPHGDLAEAVLTKVPPNRIDDVVYFNPGDMEVPLGLNLFQFDPEHPEQKDFIIQETINILYKLYDPGHTGIIGPRYEHWYRNAALTLMSDPEGATFIQVPKVFTDNEYLKKKFKYIKDPTVADFWTKEMAQTSDYHKSEMLGWFVSKFGAFMSNEMMRNIIGQVKSAFDLREIMDSGKILIVNLSKGSTGELNSNLLGMIFVMKILAASFSRANLPEDQRRDFTLYVDEFQNFSTDSFATILSEARKYRLSLIVANQFIGQLTDEIRDAVFGNVGSLLSFRVGPEDAEFLVKQLEPNFDANDLVNLPNGRIALKLMNQGVPTTPFSVKGFYPPLGTSNSKVAEAVKQFSRNKYGRPKEMLEKEIYASLSSPQAVKTPDSSAIRNV